MENIPATKRLRIQVSCTVEPFPNLFHSDVVYNGGNFWQADQAGVKASLEFPAIFHDCRIRVWQYGVLKVNKIMHVKRSPDCIDRKYRPFW